MQKKLPTFGVYLSSSLDNVLNIKYPDDVSHVHCQDSKCLIISLIENGFYNTCRDYVYEFKTFKEGRYAIN